MKPGESGTIPFSIRSTNLRGPFQKAITVNTNDPANETIRLVLKGKVKRYVEATPDRANFGRLIGKEPVTKVLTLTNNSGKPFELSMGENPTPKNFTYELTEIEKGQKYELKVTANPPFTPGRLRGVIKVNSNIEQQNPVNIGLTGVVPERLDVSPSRVVVPDSNKGAGKPLKRQLTLTNFGDTDVKLLEATSDDPKNIKLSHVTKREGKEYTISVEIPAGYKLPPAGRTITLKTDDPKKPEVKVPVQSPRSRNQRKPQKRPAELMVGQTAPDFKLNTTGGKEITKASQNGKITVLDFFAPNCPHCKRQIPTVDKLRPQYESKGVEFVYVSQTMRGRVMEDAKIIELLAQIKATGPLAIDSANTVGPLFKATSFPTMVILGKTGKIEAVNIGNRKDLDTRMKAQLDALIAGRPVPKFDEQPKQPTKSRRRPAMDLVGKPAPAFEINTLDGKTISSSKWGDYKATVLNFVAPNCGFCKRQVPNVEKVRKDYVDKGILFVNVVQKMRKDYTADQVVEVFAGAGSQLPIAHDPTNTVGQKYKARSFPTMVVVDRAGKVDNVHIGAKADLEKTLRTQLDALIAGPSTAKPLPPETADAKPKKRRRRPALNFIGRQAPAFSIDTVGGKTVSSDDLSKFNATILNFVAPNCGFCKRQVPNVEKVRKDYESRGVQFVNMAQKMRKDYTTEEIVQTFAGVGSNLDVAHDKGNTIGRQYKAQGFPTMFVLDRNGKVHDVIIGAKADIEQTLRQHLDALIAGPSKAVPLPPEDEGQAAAPKTEKPKGNINVQGNNVTIRRVDPSEVPENIRKAGGGVVPAKKDK